MNAKPVTRADLYRAIREAVLTTNYRPGQAVFNALPDGLSMDLITYSRDHNVQADPYEIKTVGNTYAWIDTWLNFNEADEVVGVNW